MVDRFPSSFEMHCQFRLRLGVGKCASCKKARMGKWLKFLLHVSGWKSKGRWLDSRWKHIFSFWIFRLFPVFTARRSPFKWNQARPFTCSRCVRHQIRLIVQGIVYLKPQYSFKFNIQCVSRSSGYPMSNLGCYDLKDLARAYFRLNFDDISVFPRAN